MLRKRWKYVECSRKRVLPYKASFPTSWSNIYQSKNGDSGADGIHGTPAPFLLLDSLTEFSEKSTTKAPYHKRLASFFDFFRYRTSLSRVDHHSGPLLPQHPGLLRFWTSIPPCSPGQEAQHPVRFGSPVRSIRAVPRIRRHGCAVVRQLRPGPRLAQHHLHPPAFRDIPRATSLGQMVRRGSPSLGG